MTEEHDKDMRRRRQKGKETSGPTKGEFIAPPQMNDADEPEDALPAQEEFWRPPTASPSWNTPILTSSA